MQAAIELMVPAVLVVVMLGLGVSLRPVHVVALKRSRRVVLHVLVSQLIILPLLCIGMVDALNLPPALAVGALLVAAAPGGPGAALLSAVFGTHTELSAPVTAVNTIVALVTMPLLTAFALRQFGQDVVVLPGDIVVACLLTIGPVVLGALGARVVPSLALRLHRLIRVAGPLAMAAVAVLVLMNAQGGQPVHLLKVLGASVLFCVLGLIVGFALPRLAGIADSTSIAAGFLVGLNNATLAMFVALRVLNNPESAVPPAVYGLVMFPVAALWGVLVTRVIEPAPTADRRNVAI